MDTFNKVLLAALVVIFAAPYAERFAQFQAFKTFKAERECVELINFGKPVNLEFSSEGGTRIGPRIQAAYQCAKLHPGVVVLD